VVGYNRVCSKQQSSYSKKTSLFIVNYKRELRKEADIRRKEKVEKVTEFAERMKNTRKSRSSIKLSIKGNRITTR